MPRRRRRPLRLLVRGQTAGVVLALFALGVFAVYAASPVVEVYDSRLVVYTGDSLMRQGNVGLDEYGPIVHGWPCYRARGRVLSRFPQGTAVFTVPFLAVAEAGARAFGHDPVRSLRSRFPHDLEKQLASVITALAAVALVVLAREVVGRMAPALALGVAFAFGTSLWSTASRGLWQHGPSVLASALAMTWLVRGRRTGNWRWSALAGLPLGMAFAIRPTFAAAIILVALVLLFTNRIAAAGVLAAAALVAVPFVALSLVLYGTLIAPVYLPGGGGPVVGGVSPTLAEGLAGTMISPGRGLLVYSPLVALAFVGLWLRRRSLNALDVVAVGMILVLWFAVANITTWEGGGSFGPRLLTDTLAFWGYLIAPVFGLVVRPVRTWTPAVAALAAVLVLTTAWSSFVHGRGAVRWDTEVWNVEPTPAFSVDDRHRLWDWSDPQFLRGGGATEDAIYPDYELPPLSIPQLCVYTT